MSHFGLCKYSDGQNALKRLNEILLRTGADPNPHPYQDYTDNSAIDNLGVPIKAGLPRVHWHWDWLPQEEIDLLWAYAGQVYVRTETNRGIVRAFELFSGTMIEPVVGEPVVDEAGKPPFAQMRGPVDIDFVLLVSV